MKTLAVLLILCPLLSFSGKSQGIITTDKNICFDSTSAVKVLKTIHDIDYYSNEADLYKEIITGYDQVLTNKDSLISTLHNENLALRTSCQDVINNQNTEIHKLKRQKKEFIKWFSVGAIVVVLSTIVLMK